MSIYRVKVEVIGREKRPIAQRLKDGIECDGFALLLRNREHSTAALHGISAQTIAGMLGSNEVLKTACDMVNALESVRFRQEMRLLMKQLEDDEEEEEAQEEQEGPVNVDGMPDLLRRFLESLEENNE